MKRSVIKIGIVSAAAGLALLGTGASASAASGISNISQGSSNYWGVQCVQQGVNDWASRTKGWRPLPVDGKFGPKTVSWVKQFQHASGGSADGIVGWRTGDSLLANLSGDGNQRRDCYYHLPSSHH